MTMTPSMTSLTNTPVGPAEPAPLSGRKPHTEAFLRKRIGVADLKRAHEGMNACLRTAGANPKSMMIIGPSGVGKSVIVEEFRRQHPAIETDDRTVQPVVYTGLRGKVNVNGILTLLLDALHDPSPERGRTVDKVCRAGKLIQLCGVRMVIIDEIQQTLPEHTTARAQEAADLIKSLIDETHVPFVLVGVNDSIRLLQAQNTGDPTRDQLRRRFRRTMEIEPYNVESASWKRLLSAFQKALGVPCIDLTSEEMSHRIYLATFGLIGRVSNLLEEALELSDGTTQMTVETLAQAHLNANPVYDIPENPFEVPVKHTRRLLAEACFTQ